MQNPMSKMIKVLYNIAAPNEIILKARSFQLKHLKRTKLALKKKDGAVRRRFC